jgi:hypothetical protein
MRLICLSFTRAQPHDWKSCFNSRLNGPDLSAKHDGMTTITVECWPDDDPQWLEKVDAAIEYTNGEMEKLND